MFVVAVTVWFHMNVKSEDFFARMIERRFCEHTETLLSKGIITLLS